MHCILCYTIRDCTSATIPNFYLIFIVIFEVLVLMAHDVSAHLCLWHHPIFRTMSYFFFSFLSQYFQVFISRRIFVYLLGWLEPQPKKEKLLDASKGMKNPSAFDGVQKVFGTVCALLRRPLGYRRYSKSRLSPLKVYSFLFFFFFQLPSTFSLVVYTSTVWKNTANMAHGES